MGKVFVLLAAVCHFSHSAPQLLYGAFPYVHHAAAVVTGNSVPVAVGGYKAVAGDNGDLKGPVHEVPGLVPALAVHKQELRSCESVHWHWCPSPHPCHWLLWQE